MTSWVGQPHRDVGEYRHLGGFHVNFPAFIDELVGNICEYYRYHLRCEVEFLADEEYGDAHRPNSDFTLNERLVSYTTYRWLLILYGIA